MAAVSVSIVAGSHCGMELLLPYGQERWTDGPAQTDFTFTGQRADNYTHLIEMGARWLR
jgi:hypothetical protein